VLVSCFCATGGCAIAGGCAGSEGDSDSDVCVAVMVLGGDEAVV